MHGLHQLIRIGSDDRVRLKDATGCAIIPAIPEAREREDLTVPKLNGPWLLGSVPGFLPFVKACRRHQTTPAVHRLSERWTAGDGFRARINSGVADFRVLREKWNQAPSQQSKLSLGAVPVQTHHELI